MYPLEVGGSPSRLGRSPAAPASPHSATQCLCCANPAPPPAGAPHAREAARAGPGARATHRRCWLPRRRTPARDRHETPPALGRRSRSSPARRARPHWRRCACKRWWRRSSTPSARRLTRRRRPGARVAVAAHAPGAHPGARSRASATPPRRSDRRLRAAEGAVLAVRSVVDEASLAVLRGNLLRVCMAHSSSATNPPPSRSAASKTGEEEALSALDRCVWTDNLAVLASFSRFRLTYPPPLLLLPPLVAFCRGAPCRALHSSQRRRRGHR